MEDALKLQRTFTFKAEKEKGRLQRAQRWGSQCTWDTTREERSPESVGEEKFQNCPRGTSGSNLSHGLQDYALHLDSAFLLVV